MGGAWSFNSRFFGADHHNRRGGRGAEWSGDACVALASPMVGRCEGTQGDPRVPTLLPCHSRPYETNSLPCSFHKIPTLEGGAWSLASLYL